MNSRPIIAITGATGFLGGHLALAAMARGAHVRAVVRTPEKARWMADRGVEVREADLGDTRALAQAFRGADVVIANAARTTAKGGTYEDARRDNVDGTTNQAMACVGSGVQRIVYISTIAVYRTQLGKMLDESAPIRDPGVRATDIGAVVSSPKYARTKAAAELRLWELAREHDLQVTSLRPGPIYGPGWSRLSERYRGLLRRRVVALPTARFPHVHAADVALAALAATDHDVSIGRAYNVAGPPARPPDLVAALSRAAGRGPVVVPIPVPFRLAFDDTAVGRDLGVTLRSAVEGAKDILVDEVWDSAAAALYATG